MNQKDDRIFVGCEDTKTIFNDIFGDSVIMIQEQVGEGSRNGWFKIEWKYLPLKYGIVFENEISSFNIRIENGEKWYPLNQIMDYKKEPTLVNVKQAVVGLKKSLNDDILFYVKKNNHLYQETKSGKLKRII